MTGGASLSLEALPFAALRIDAAYRICAANAMAASLFSLPSMEDNSFLSLKDFIAEDDALLQYIASCVRDAHSVKAYDHVLLFKDNEIPQVSLSVSPFVAFSEMDDSTARDVLVLIDAPEGAERAAQDAAQQDTEQQIAILAAMLAHEIKNPLSGIRGAAQLLESQSSSNTSLCTLIQNETRRITDILDKVEFLADDAVLTPAPVNVHELLHYVRSVLDPTLCVGLEFHEVFDPSLPPVMGEAPLLTQLFINVIGNALECFDGCKDGPRAVTITTACCYDFRPRQRHQRPLTVRITVEDSGPGIAPELQSQLFAPFVSTKKRGSGLGLAIAARICRGHGGLIELVHSRPGSTRFQILLPAAKTAAF